MQKLKPQTKAVIVLNCVIVLLITGLFFVYATRDKPDDNPTGSKLPDIYTSWQVNLSEHNEKPVASFTAPDMKTIHIFGNCSDGENKNRVFFAAVSEGELVKEELLDFTTALSISPNKIYDYSLKKACVAETGYMLALQGYINTVSGKIDVSFVAAVDYEGKIVKADIHTVISPERVADAFYDQGKLYMVVQTGYSDMNINNIKIYRYSTDVTLEQSLSADHLGNMEYLYMATYKNGYLLCFNVAGAEYNCVAFAYLVPGTNATFSYAKMQSNYRATDFTVYKNGYALLCVDENDNSFLLKLSNNFEILNTSYFSGHGNKYEGKIIYTEKGYFIHGCTTKDLYLYDENLNESKMLTSCDSVCDSVANGNSVVISTIEDENIKLCIINSEEKTITLKANGAQKFAALLRTSSGLTLVATNEKGFDVLKVNGDVLIDQTL